MEKRGTSLYFVTVLILLEVLPLDGQNNDHLELI